jgi:hypothetical protein
VYGVFSGEDAEFLNASASRPLETNSTNEEEARPREVFAED